MTQMGSYHTLTVARSVDFGLYLVSKEGEEILLPKKYIPQGTEIGDSLRVFLYTDSEDRPVATTLDPKAAVGGFATMEVVSVAPFGAFVDWGLEKDLFVPHKEQQPRLRRGQRAVVRVLLDEKTNRVIGSNRLERYIQKTPKGLKVGQPVKLHIVEQSPLGFTALIEDCYLGMIFQNEVFEPLEIGDERMGFVKTIRKDGKVDLSLQLGGAEGENQSADRLLEALRQAGGKLAVGYKIEPAEAMSRFGLSRKAFKRALTKLSDEGKIEISQTGVELLKT